MKLFESMSDLARSGYVFRIQDNGGSSADRYTVAFCDGDHLALSRNPSHPQGVSLWGQGIDPAAMAAWAEDGEAVDLALGDLPGNVAAHLLARVNQGWADFLAAVEAREPHAVAPDRASAAVNHGLHDSAGAGIYATPEGLRVRLDGAHAADDRGPYPGAREALLATLPDAYALSGPEHHPAVDPNGLDASPEGAERVAELEARVEAAWQNSR